MIIHQFNKLLKENKLKTLLSFRRNTEGSQNSYKNFGKTGQGDSFIKEKREISVLLLHVIGVLGQPFSHIDFTLTTQRIKNIETLWRKSGHYALTLSSCVLTGRTPRRGRRNHFSNGA